ncbi:MAG TPA: glycosyltransferase family 4 protein [Candidatus Aquilonibacter sp.]|nr:glycosyltransferase family 4 protein [Candidatus Aquilonibacter sp.]
MRLLILTQYYPPEIGAPQTRLAALARHVASRGHEVEVVTAMPHHLLGRTYDGYRGKLYMRDEIDGVPVHRTWVYAATGTGLRRIANYLSFTATSMIGLLRAKKPDLVFVESPPLFLSIPGWLIAKLRGAQMIFNVADLWPDSVRELGVMSDGPLMRIAERLEAWSYRRAHLINAVTDGIDDALRKKKLVPDSKLRFLPNGIDVDRFVPARANEELRSRLGLDGRPVFIYAGTHGIAQGLHNVVEAAALAGRSAQVLFVGSGPTKPALKARVRERGIDNVHFVDPVPLDSMPEYFSLACASIVPLVRSDLMRGARPSKLFPAFACGVPVIYSGEGEGAALVADAGAGIVVPPEDSHAIAQAMRAIAGDPAARERMSRSARALALDRFAWSSIVDTWLHSLERGTIGA